MAKKKLAIVSMKRRIHWLICSMLLAFPACAQAAAGEFHFKHHFIDTDLPGINYGLTDCADIGHDGHPAFITGGKDKDKTIYWFEYQGRINGCGMFWAQIIPRMSAARRWTTATGGRLHANFLENLLIQKPEKK
jgi:hypothetical protein